MKMKKMSFFGLPIKRQTSDFVVDDEEPNAMHIYPNAIGAPSLGMPKHIDSSNAALHLHTPHLVTSSRKLAQVAAPRQPAPLYETPKAAIVTVDRGQQPHCPSIYTPRKSNIAELLDVTLSPRPLLKRRLNPPVGCSNKRRQSYAMQWPQRGDGQDLRINQDSLNHTCPHSDDITDWRGWYNLRHRNETFPPSLLYKPSSQQRLVNGNSAPRIAISTQKYILNDGDMRESHSSVPQTSITCFKTKKSSVRTSSTNVTESYTAVQRMQTLHVGVNPFSSRASSLETGRQLTEKNPYRDRAITVSYDARELNEQKVANTKEQHQNTTFERGNISHTSHGDDRFISSQPRVPESFQLTRKSDEPRPVIPKSYFASPICDQSRANRDTASGIIVQSGNNYPSAWEKFDTAFIETRPWSEARLGSKSIGPTKSRDQSITGQEAIRQEVGTPKSDLSRYKSDCVPWNETEDDSPESLLSLFNRRRKAGYYNCQLASQINNLTQNEGVKNDVPEELSLNLLNDPIVVADPVHDNRRPPTYTIEVINPATKSNTSKPLMDSTPLRIQSSPRTKKTDITRSSILAKPELSKLKQIPRTQKRQTTNNLLTDGDFNVLRQRQVASLIVSKGIEVERIELDKTLFDETDSGSENKKAERLKTDAKNDFGHQAKLPANKNRIKYVNVVQLEKSGKLAGGQFESNREEEEENESNLAKGARRKIELRLDQQAKQCVTGEFQKQPISKINAGRQKGAKEAIEKGYQSQIVAENAPIIQGEDRHFASLKTVQGRANREPLSRKSGKKIIPGGRENHFLNGQVDLDLHDNDGDEDDGDSLFISDRLSGGYVCQTMGESVRVGSTAKTIQSKATRNQPEKMRRKTRSEKRIKNSQKEDDLSNIRSNGYYYERGECQESLSLDVPTREEGSMPTKTFRERRKAGKAPPKLVTHSNYENIELPGFLAKLTRFESIENDRCVHETQPEANNDQEVEFSWSPMGSPKIKLVKVVVASQVPPHSNQVPSITATKDMHLNSARTVSGTNLHAHLQSLTQKPTQQPTLEKLRGSTYKKRVEQSEKDRIEHQDADWRKREHKSMAEKKRKEILPDTEINDITITRTPKLSDILMENREKDPQYRASKRTQKAAEVPTSQDGRLQRLVPPIPQATQSFTSDGENLTVEEMMRKQMEAAKKKRQAIARERNTSFHLAAMKKTVESIETDSKSDEDEYYSAVRIQQSGREMRSLEDGCDGIEFDFESKDDEAQPLIGGQHQSLYSLCPKGIPSPLELLHPRKITTASKINLSSKGSSLLPKNILDPPVKPVLAEIMRQQSPDIILVNIYRIMQQRVRGNEAMEPRLVDNYALPKDAENRILAELQKFRDSGIAIYSCTTEPHPETKLLSARIIHTKKKDTYTDWNIEIETRLSDTLSGYDPELFTPVFQPLIYNVIQQNVLKDQYAEEVVDEETGELRPGANWSSKVLASMTSLQMANAAACEQMVKLTKPESQRIDEVSVHSDLAKQLRETVDSCDRAVEGMSAELTSDEDCLPWLRYGTLKIFVEEQQLKGPRN